jgi:iron complex outermembrane receptor protein
MGYSTRAPLRALLAVTVSANAIAAAHADEAAPKPSEQTETKVERVIVTGSKASGGEFGSKSGIPLDKLPQSVQVLTEEDMKERGVISMGDALRSVPSANVGTPRTSAYQSFSLKVRGFLADQMRNGVRQRYFEDVDASSMSNIERIEVLKGPSAVLFGQSAVGGIVSIITKRPQREFAASASATVGSHDRYVGSFDVTGPVSEDDGLFFRATGEIERSGTFVDFQDIDRENAALSLTFAPSEDVTAYLVAEWQERRTMRNPGLPIVGTVLSNGVADIPTARFLGEPAVSNLEAFGPLIQAWADIKVADGWTLTPRVSYSGFDSNFTQIRVLEVQADKVTTNRNGRFGKEDDNYTISQLDLQGEFTTGGIGHKLLIGAEYDRERASFLQYNIRIADVNAVLPINALAPAYQFGATPVPLEFAYFGTFDIDGVAAYAQDIIDLTSRWNVVAGVRSSWMRSFNTFNGAGDDSRVSNVVYQLGSTYKLDDHWSIYGGANTGFDNESTSGAFSKSGQPFDPEESDQIEAGLRYTSGDLRASAAVFQIRRTNVLTADPSDPDFSIQTGEVRVRGFEIEGAWNATDELTIEGGYAYLDGKVTKSNNGDQGQQLADTPEHQANIFVRYDVPGLPLQLRAGANYVGDRQFSNASVDLIEGAEVLLANTVTLPDYVTVDLGASLMLDNTRFDLAVTNIFDETYFTREFNNTSVFPGEPRQVSLRVSQAF